MQLQLTHSRTIHMAPRTATDKHTRAPVFKSYTKNSPQTQPSPTRTNTSRATVKRYKNGWHCPNMAIRIKRARMNTNMMTSANERRVNGNWTFTRQHALLMIDERWRATKRASNNTHSVLSSKVLLVSKTLIKLPFFYALSFSVSFF